LNRGLASPAPYRPYQRTRANQISAAAEMKLSMPFQRRKVQHIFAIGALRVSLARK